jgi:uncharacterized sulfatase
MAGVKVPANIQGLAFYPAQSAKREFIAAARDRCGDADDRIRCIRTDRFKYIRNFRPELPYAQHSSYKEVQYPMLPLMRQLNAEHKLTPAQAAFFSDTKPPEELYDVLADPWEMQNLAPLLEHSATLKDLREKLDRWMKDTGDMGGTPETHPTLVEIIANTRRTTYDKPMKQRGLPPEPTDQQMIDWWQLYYRK